MKDDVIRKGPLYVSTSQGTRPHKGLMCISGLDVCVYHGSRSGLRDMVKCRNCGCGHSSLSCGHTVQHPLVLLIWEACFWELEEDSVSVRNKVAALWETWGVETPRAQQRSWSKLNAVGLPARHRGISTLDSSGGWRKAACVL